MWPLPVLRLDQQMYRVQQQKDTLNLSMTGTRRSNKTTIKKKVCCGRGKSRNSQGGWQTIMLELEGHWYTKGLEDVRRWARLRLDRGRRWQEEGSATKDVTFSKTNLKFPCIVPPLLVVRGHVSGSESALSQSTLETKQQLQQMRRCQERTRICVTCNTVTCDLCSGVLVGLKPPSYIC